MEEVLAGPPVEQWRWEELRGKAVVVELWATWCAPCVAAIPHWNELAEELSGEPVVFLSISDEDRATVEPFLEQHEIAGWVAVDTDRSVFEGLRVTGIPHTVLVGPDGRIVAQTYPMGVEPGHLRALAAGRHVEAPPLEASDGLRSIGLDQEGGPAPLFLAEIRPAAGSTYRGAVSDDELVVLGVDARSAIVLAFEGRRTRLAVEAELPAQTYDLVFQVPAEQRAEVVQRAVETVFGIEVAPEVRDRPVLALRATPHTAEKLGAMVSSAGGMSTSWGPGRFGGIGIGLDDLASGIETSLGIPVVDETGLGGGYDFVLSWDDSVAGDLERVLAEQLGLVLVRAERPIEILTVRPAGGDG